MVRKKVSSISVSHCVGGLVGFVRMRDQYGVVGDAFGKLGDVFGEIGDVFVVAGDVCGKVFLRTL